MLVLCVCVLDMLLVVCWLGIVSNAKNHTVPCCRATRSWLHSNNEKKRRCPDDCNNIYFWARRLLSETNSETEIAIRDKIRSKIGTMDEVRHIGFDNINNVNTCEVWNYNGWRHVGKTLQNNSKRLGGSTLYIGSFCWFRWYVLCHVSLGRFQMGYYLYHTDTLYL